MGRSKRSLPGGPAPPAGEESQLPTLLHPPPTQHPNTTSNNTIQQHHPTNTIQQTPCPTNTISNSPSHTHTHTQEKQTNLNPNTRRVIPQWSEGSSWQGKRRKRHREQ